MLGTRTSFDPLIGALRDLDIAGASFEASADILAAAAIDERDLAAYANFQPLRYTRNLVYRSDAFELLVLCWSRGSASPIHDHGGMHCAMKLLCGSLNVDDFTILAGGRRPGYALIDASGATTMLPGSLDVRSTNRVLHRVAAREPAISLHVYAQPLNRFMTFDRERRSCRTVYAHDDTLPDPPAPFEQARA